LLYWYKSTYTGTKAFRGQKTIIAWGVGEEEAEVNVYAFYLNFKKEMK
jgi:hypothetical protein